MNRIRIRTGISCLAVLAVALMHVDRARAETTTREQIAAARAAVQAEALGREGECEKRFVVASCVEAVKREQRKALAAVSQQEVQLNEAERHQRATARTHSIRAKIDQAPQPRDEVARPAARKSRSRPEPKVEPTFSEELNEAAAADRLAQEEIHKAAFAAKEQAAQAHRAAAERRRAERKTKLAAPLPEPQ